RLRDAFQPKTAQRGARLAVVRDLLSLGNLAQLAIVENKIRDAQAVGDGGNGLQTRHQKRSITDDADHLPLWVGEFCADGCGDSVAHGVEIRGRNEGSWMAYF